MKLQQLAVIFVIIVLPISLVLSIYTNNNISVLETQADYNDILLTATNDAVQAYQLNTLRNGYSTVNDSKIRDISASVNSFFNSLASGLGSSGYRREDLEPYLVVLNSLPKIALGPIIIIWFGAGSKAIIFMCILIVIIVTIMNILNSFTSCDKQLIALAKSLGANKFQIFFKLILPNSLKDIVATLKINVGLSWIGAIMGEYLVSKAGLGYLLIYGGQVFNLNLVMTATVILCILASVMYFAVALFEKLMNKFYE